MSSTTLSTFSIDSMETSTDFSSLNTTDPGSNMSEYSFASAEEYLEKMVGPKYLPLSAVLPITIVYVIIFVTGVVGNVCVCLVIVKNPSLQTATNFYLFSLSVSDLTVLVLGLPNDLKVYWQQYPWGLGVALCKIRALVSEMTSYVSVLVIVAFSLERYLAICHPLLSYTMAGLRRAARIIAGSWFVALIAAAPFALYTNVHYIEFPEDSGIYLETICYMPNATWPLIFSSFAFFIVPMAILLFIYVSIGVQIRRASAIRGTMDGSRHGDVRHRGNRKAILRMLVAVVIGFFLCFAPHHAQRLLYIYGKDLPNFRAINEYMYYLTGCLYYFSATINPILYNVMSAKYRQAFQETLCGRRSRSTFGNNSTVRGSSQLHSKGTLPLPGTGSTISTARVQRFSSYRNDQRNSSARQEARPGLQVDLGQPLLGPPTTSLHHPQEDRKIEENASKQHVQRDPTSTDVKNSSQQPTPAAGIAHVTETQL